MIKFLDLLRIFALKQHVTDFTHIDGHILDLVISTETDSIIKDKATVQSLISDHFLVLCSLDIASKKEQQKSVKCRKMNDIDSDLFRKDLAESKLNELVTAERSLEELVGDYNEILQCLLDKNAPETVKTLKPRLRQPWYTAELRSLRRNSRCKERKMRKTPKTHCNFDEIRADFKTAEDLYFKSVDSSKTSYYSNLVLSNKKDQGKLFKVLNCLMSKKKDNPLPAHDSVANLANIFGHYFTDKIAKIRDSFRDDGDPFEYDHCDGSSSFSSFRELRIDEVIALIRASSSKTSMQDPIPTSLLKQCAS